ncbi:YhdP family protein [Oceanospirillum sp.]|uniref:YhdP family phospholipid transporter n=1 Tax=Oceanospirillum sp. TaxID=2021254 RepID=UPI003A92EC80
MSLPRHIFNHSIIWLVLPVVVVLALYVSIGRYFFPLLENYRDDLTSWANAQLAINLRIDQLHGQWNDFDPYIHLDQVEVYAPQVHAKDGIKPALEVRSFSLELDSFRSFRYQFPVIRQASIQGVTLRLKQEEDARWLLNGWNQQNSVSDKTDQIAEPSDRNSDPRQRGRSDRLRDEVAPITHVLEFLLRQQHLKMEHVWLELTDRFGREYRAYSRRLEVYEVEGKRRLQGQLQLDPGSPQQIGFILEIAGDPFDQKSLTVELYLQADSQSLSSWLEKIEHLLPFDIPELNGGLELWSDWQGGRLQSLKGRLKDGKLELNLPDQPKVYLANLNTELFWQRQASGWELITDNLSFSLQNRPFVLKQAVARQKNDDWQVQLSNLDLEKISDTLLEWPDLPEKARDALVRLKPRGELHNLSVSQSESDGFLVKTEVDSVSVDAYYGAPILRNVNGYVQSSAHDGFIRFHSDEFFMGYPQLYSGGWWFDKAIGEVHWQIGDMLRVFGLDLQLNRGATEIAGEFDLLQPKEGDDLFYLNVGLTGADETFGLRLVPDLIIQGTLSDWLGSSIKSAEVKQGGFIYDGTLNLNSSRPDREVATLLLLDVEKSKLQFLPEWPAAEALDAQVRLDGTDLDVSLNSGRYLQNEGISGDVTLRNDGVGSVVGLNLDGRVYPEWGWQVLTETPLSALIPESLLDWQLSGKPLAFSTNLIFPVDGRKGSGQVNVQARDGVLFIPELATPVSQLNGDITYDIDRGLSVRKATAEFLGGETAFDVETDRQTAAVRVAGSGQSDLIAINQWQPMPFSSWLSGTLDYQFSVNLNKESQLHLTSKLNDVVVSLPEPIGKEANTERPLKIDMTFTPEANYFSVAYDHRDSEGFLISHGIWGGDQQGYGVGVWYGDATDHARLPTVSNQRTDIYIKEPTFNVDPWVEFASAEVARQSLASSVIDSGGQGPAEQSSAAETQPVRMHLETAKAIYEDTVVNDLAIDAVLNDKTLDARFASQQLEGAASFTPDLLQLDMQRVFIASPQDIASEPANAASAKEKRHDIFEQVFRSEWPDFDLKIADFSIYGVSGQQLDAAYRAERSSRQVSLSNLSQGSAHFSGALDWLIGDTADNTDAQTSLILNIKGGDLKDIQTGFSIPAAITSSQSDSTIRLNWQGLPHDVRSETLNGQVSVDLERGSFEQVVSVPALKLLSLLNFESLVRRLQLDFSDLSGKGLSYDKVTGRVDIKNGIGIISEPVQVEGTATKFEMTGELDFVEERFDQEMVVTLPVGETLPFAAILAGAPQVGGTIYIVQKVFGNLFDKFTQATYTIRGEWDDPQIELKRVF